MWSSAMDIIKLHASKMVMVLYIYIFLNFTTVLYLRFKYVSYLCFGLLKTIYLSIYLAIYVLPFSLYK